MNPFLLLLLIFIMPSHAMAATLSFSGSNAPLHIGEERELSVLLDAEGVSLNAISGAILFPSEMLVVDHIDLGSSPVDIWVEEPAVRSSGVISWSGIVPGGWSGVRGAFFTGLRPGRLFKIVFRVVGAGAPAFSFQDLIAKANDGNGTAVDLVGRQSFISLIDGYSGASSSESDSLAVGPSQSTGDETSRRGILWYAALGCIISLLFAYAVKKISNRIF